ncbi:MAG: heme ABC exporter ATP-binding protein CcmA [Alphaproteobacteria bacterium]|nr:heme ABC exporter ATP-binding protein CcmA [Alphaproteobacteria bacterium]
MPLFPFTITNLSCTRAKRNLFAPVNFTLDAGGVFILHGENGSGKSTLLRALAGLFPYNGAPLSSYLYLGHANALHPSMTAIEHLDFWRALYATQQTGNDGQKSTNELILDTLGLTAQRHQLAAQISNGQKRRLSFARLLVQQADVWLLDEPQAALDAAGVQMLLKLVGQHTQNGGAAIIASHDDLAINSAQIIQLQAAA